MSAPTSIAPENKTQRRSGRDLVLALLAGAALFLLVDAAVFRTGWYQKRLEPESTTGITELVLHAESIWQGDGLPRVVCVGDSRMSFLPKLANDRRLPLKYGSAAVAGTSPRCWPYLLRAVDPTAKRYRAILIPVESYEDDDPREDMSARVSDLNYIVGQLDYGDLLEFSLSHPDRESRIRAARGILLRGFVYQRDIHQFLSNPIARMRKVNSIRPAWHEWAYAFPGDPRTLAGMTVDWNTRTVQFPPGTQPVQEETTRRRLFERPGPQTGKFAAYRAHWLGKIVDRYAGTGTKVIFVPLPRGPVLRPDQPKLNPESVIRRFARQPHVRLLDARLFEDLERPELFYDYQHLNAEGSRRFTLKLAQEVERILGAS